MTRDWKISIVTAMGCHLAALYGFQVALSTPAQLVRDTAVEVTLVAAPAAVAPQVEIPLPVTPPEPIIKPPEPLPVAEPEPVVTQPTPPVAAAPAPPTTAVGDNSSPEPGLDRTTIQAQPGVPAKTKYRRNPKPAYPPPARRRGQEGLVLLAVRVTTEGRAVEVTLKQSSGYPLLDESALNAVRRWEFEPARIGSIAVESEIEVPVRFRLTE